MSSSKSIQRPLPAPSVSQPSFRSGAVARMAGMPVATLRIWEQRYQAVRPSTAASGHRLYSAADVERVSLMRRLTEQGHAIGLLAGLDIEQLWGMVRTDTGPRSAPRGDAPTPSAAMRVVVVGAALAQRLQRLPEHPSGGPALQCLGVFDSLAEAAQAAQATPDSAEPAADLLLWQTGSLQAGARHGLRVAQEAWRAPACAVVYRYGSAAGRAELIQMGAAVLQEPVDDASLEHWLADLNRPETRADTDRHGPAWDHLGAVDSLDRTVSAPRFADAALTEFAGLSSAIACECPSHLAGLLLQLSSFETYSGECANRSVADAQLHAYLQRVAGTARMLFETALERVAIAEGLPLPASPHGKAASTDAGTARVPPDFSI